MEIMLVNVFNEKMHIIFLYNYNCTSHKVMGCGFAKSDQLKKRDRESKLFF